MYGYMHMLMLVAGHGGTPEQPSAYADDGWPDRKLVTEPSNADTDDAESWCPASYGYYDEQPSVNGADDGSKSHVCRKPTDGELAVLLFTNI